MKKIQLFCLTILLSWIVIATAGSVNDNNGSKIIDFESVVEAVNSIVITLEDQGLEIVGVIDISHSTYAKKNSLTNARLIVFRNNQLEELLQRNLVDGAIDLPQKILIWEDKQAQIHITYNDQLSFADRHELKALDNELSELAENENGDIIYNGLTPTALASASSEESYCSTTYSSGQQYENCVTLEETCMALNTLKKKKRKQFNDICGEFPFWNN